MAFSIRKREVSGVCILDLDGRLVSGEPVSSLRTAVDEIQSSGRSFLLLNFADSHYVDSAGLGALVAAHSAFKEISGALKLLHVSERSTQLLVLTRLSTLFEIFDDETAAVDSFFPERAIRGFDILQFVKSQEDPVPET